MSLRLLVLALSAGFVVATVSADNAQPRGGSGSSSSSSAGARHHSPGSSSAQSGGRSSGGSSSSGSSVHSSGSSQSGRSSDRTIAERRHPRAGTGTGSWPSYGYGYPGYYPGYYPGWYYPYWPSYYYGLSYAYGGFWPYGGYYGGGPGPVYYSYRTGPDTSALRVFGEPSKTRVFVDGYYAGVIDDFDGLFQRLYLAPGRHEIKLKLDGYRTHRVLVYVSPGQTLKLDHDMEKGAGEETFEDLTGGRGEREMSGERRPTYEEDDDADRPAPEGRGGEQPSRHDAARLRLDVRPADASVYVDGQFRGTARELGELELAPGPHRIEVVRPGFRTEERDFDLAPGSARELSIELSRP